MANEQQLIDIEALSHFKAKQDVENAKKFKSKDDATDLAGAVRYDTAQALTEEQKAQARKNIGAGTVDETNTQKLTADKVVFTKDLVTTSEIGRVTLEDGKATIPAKDKSVAEVWDYIFCEDKTPTVTQPSVSLSAPNNKAYEVGTSVTPSFSSTFNSGDYEYDDSTGVTVESWEVSNNENDTVFETASGSFDEIVVDDSTNFKITAKATHTAGNVPKTVLGNDYADGQIASGDKYKTSSAITGYRNTFYGTLESKTALTSDIIRGLSKSGKALKNGSTFEVDIPEGAVRVVIAYPATLRDITSIKDENGMSAEISSAFSVQTIDVNDFSGNNAISYKVYTLDYGVANDTANTYSVTI